MTWRLSDYEPVGQLGSGATGRIWAARDIATSSMVAIRYLHKDIHRAPGFADRYRREAAVLASLDNPNLAHVYEYVERPQGVAVVGELVDGMSVRALLDHGGALDPRAALVVIKGALRGLADVHRSSVLHRDVRPENILVTTAGDVKVVDVGLVRGTGDPRYRAPELWMGEAASATTDVWAVAATLFECLTGRPPRAADGRPLGKLAPSEETEIRTVAPLSLPDRVRRLVTRDLGMRADLRAKDAGAMLNELDLAAVAAYDADWEEPGRAALIARLGRAATEPRTVRRASRDRRRLLIAVAAGLVVVLGAGAAVWTGISPAAGNPRAGQPSASGFEHTPDPTIGPSMPASANPTRGVDHRGPDRPLGLKIIGRSVTGVSLDWNPTRDNVKVAGYIVTRNGHPVGTTFTPGFTDSGLTAATKYAYAVTAFDAAGNRSPLSPVVYATTLTAPDVLPPSVPTGLHATGESDTTIYLAWTAATDNIGVAGYDVFRDGVKIGSSVQPVFTDTGRTAATAYQYAVRAFDTSNNASALSAGVPVATLPGKDTQPPATPSGMTAASNGQTSIALSWLSSTDNVGVIGYRVFRGNALITTVTGTTYTDGGLTPGTQYTYSVTALDAAGNASGRSGAASATTDAPPPTPAVASIDLKASPISTGTNCQTTITATVVVTGGAMTVDLNWTINTTGGQTQIVFAGPGTKSVDLATVDATTDGVAEAHVDAGASDSTQWTAPAECVPAPPTPTPSPSDPTNPSPTGTDATPTSNATNGG